MARYERKFFIDGISSLEVENIVYANPGMFSEIYQTRSINNIYLDTIELASFNDNVSGVMNRKKFRIRWYGKLFGFIEKPNLEIKIKTGLVGSKKIYPLKPLELNTGFICNDIMQHLQDSNLSEDITKKLAFLRPVIMNKYSRKYFVSFDKKYRITVDINQSYCGVSGNSILSKQKNTCDTNTILEMKYNIEHDNNASAITNFFPFRLTKSSKYVNAIANLYY